MRPDRHHHHGDRAHWQAAMKVAAMMAQEGFWDHRWTLLQSNQQRHPMLHVLVARLALRVLVEAAWAQLTVWIRGDV